MKKQKTTRSAFVNPRVILGFIFCSIGACLALVGFGAFSPASANSGKDYVTRTNLPNADSRALDGAFTPADNEGRFVYLVEFSEPGLLHRGGHAPGDRFTLNTPEAQRNKAEITAEQARHVDAIGQASVARHT